MDEMVEKARLAREKREHSAEKKIQDLDFQKQMEGIKDSRDAIVGAIQGLTSFLDGNITKSEIVNQLEEIRTPDIDKVVVSLKELDATLKDTKIDLKPLTEGLVAIEGKISKLPAKFPDYPKFPDMPKPLDTVKVSNMVDLAPDLKDIKKAIKEIKFPRQEKVTVEKVDLAPIKKGLDNLLKAIGSIEIPQTVVDFSSLKEKQIEANKLLLEIVKKPVPVPPSFNSGGIIEAINNSSSGDVTSATHDNFNVNANLQVGNADVSGSNPVQVTGTVTSTGDSDLLLEIRIQNGAMAMRVDDTTGTIYQGWAEPGTLPSAAGWRIRRIVDSGTPVDTTITFADGNRNFDNIWNNRLSLSYA